MPYCAACRTHGFRTNEGEELLSARSTLWAIWSTLSVPDWMPRLRIILESGEARAFDPIDRFAQLKESPGTSCWPGTETTSHVCETRTWLRYRC